MFGKTSFDKEFAGEWDGYFHIRVNELPFFLVKIAGMTSQ